MNRGGKMDERADLADTHKAGIADKQMDRRRFLRVAGTVAWATPVVMTLSSKAAWAKAPCTPRGETCGRVVSVSGGVGVCSLSGFANCCTGCTCKSAKRPKKGQPCKCFGNCSPSKR
jgi:hypothetical protein